MTSRLLERDRHRRQAQKLSNCGCENLQDLHMKSESRTKPHYRRINVFGLGPATGEKAANSMKNIERCNKIGDITYLHRG